MPPAGSAKLSDVTALFSELLYSFLLSIYSIFLSDCKFRCPTCRIGVKHPNPLDQMSDSENIEFYLPCQKKICFFVKTFPPALRNRQTRVASRPRCQNREYWFYIGVSSCF